MKIPGIGEIAEENINDFIELESSGEGMWVKGKEGVKAIYTPLDKKVDFIVYEDKTLAYVKSALGYPAIYPLNQAEFEGQAQAVLMDLDGTSVHSESFWIWIIERTIARLMKNPKFSLEEADLPYVSGHSVSEHLAYCISKYCPDKTVEQARQNYFDITEYEMREIMEGRGKADAFIPAPNLKEFLTELKGNGIKIGLVTSGLYEKAWPEIISAFKTLKMGDPIDFYDAIITAGQAFKKGQTGTLGELSQKPHPWLYSETARIGLGMGAENRNRIIGIEDSSAGIVSVRLAGFSAIGMSGGNIIESGTRGLCNYYCNNFEEILKIII